MAVNIQQRGLLQVASSLQGRTQPVAERIRLPSDGGEEAARASAAAYSSIATELASVARQVGAYADHAAAVEGVKEGHLAGMDPEFRPRNDGTIRGEAFDKAGLETYKSNMTVAIAADVANAKTAAEVEAKRSGWLSRTPKELGPEVNLLFSREVLTKQREAAREAAATAKAEAVTSLAGEIDVLTRGLHQRAFSLGLDGTADAALAADIAQLQGRLSRKGPDGKPLLEPASIEKVLRGVRETVSDARLTGAFDRLPDIAQREAYIKKFEADFASSSGLAAGYDFGRFERMQAHLRSRLNLARSEERQGSALALETIKSFQTMTEKGFAPTDDQLAAARSLSATAAAPEVRAELEALERAASFSKAARTWTPEQLDAYAAERRAMVQRLGPNAHDVRFVTMAEKMADEARRELKTDPLGWAERVGAVKLAPLDLSSPDAAQATMRQRIVQAEEVARHYGITPVYVRPDEARRWAAVASQGGAALADVAQRIATGAGDRAEKFLAAVSDHAPVVAHIGGHVRDLGPTPVSSDAAAGIALMKTEGFKGRAPSMDEARTLAAGVHGRALADLPRDEAALIVATNAAYEVRAQRQGVSELNTDLWKRTFRELLGERTVEGETYGGVTNSQKRGWWGGAAPVVVPPDIKQGSFRDVIGAVRISDFGDMPPRRGDGSPATDRDMKEASLMQAGNGRYWINIGTSEAPVLLRDSVDRAKPFVMDLRSLEPVLRERMPNAYLGGKRSAPMKLGGPEPESGAGVAGLANEPPAPRDVGDDLPDGTPAMVVDGLKDVDARLNLDDAGRAALRQGLYTDQALQMLEEVMQAPNKRVEEFHARRLLDHLEKHYRARRP